jgi:hypothetical protein
VVKVWAFRAEVADRRVKKARKLRRMVTPLIDSFDRIRTAEVFSSKVPPT